MPNPPETHTSKQTEQWIKIKELFEVALTLNEVELTSLSHKIKSADPDLWKEVETLLAANALSTDFLEAPALISLSETFTPLRQHSFVAGDRISDFKIRKKLGSGSFGSFYLAEQLSLGREVALKITPNKGQEAKTMAPLEHDHIVKVFAQSKVTIEKIDKLNLICMQYIAGLSLAEFMNSPNIHALTRYANGKSLLELIARAIESSDAISLHTLKDREQLERLDGTSTVIWMGIRLAQALAHAHRKNILHLDVKPENILLGISGRPMLTDFNIAILQINSLTKAPELFGGTVRYMSPEHESAFTNPSTEQIMNLDARADIFSLGRVLQEFYEKWVGPIEKAPEDLRFVLAKAQEKDRAFRFANAESFAEALESCFERREILLALPPADFLTKYGMKNPLSTLVALVVLPQCMGSAVNISYNTTQIVDRLNTAQQLLFQKMVVLYNPFVYLVATSFLVWKIRKLVRFQKNPEFFLSKGEPFLKSFRKEVLNYPVWIAFITGTAWGLSSLFFTFGIDYLQGPLPRGAFYHFYISFFLSALIALSYSFLYSQFHLLRVIYPRLFRGVRGIHALAKEDLGLVPQQVRLFFFFTGVIPLSAASLLVLIGPQQSSGADNYSAFRLLVGLLIGAGVIGFTFALRTSDKVSQTLVAFIGSERH